MPSKSDYGLGILYHATPTQNVENIPSRGIINKPIWLAYDKEDAYRSALDNMNYAGSTTVFAVNLHSNWELEKAGTGEYLSWKTISARYIRRIK